jgi:Flp pilus assembly pilin Flp
MIRRLARLLRRLHRDQRGNVTVEKVLIIAFITLPLLGVLIFFKDKVIDLLKDAWSKISGSPTSSSF